MRHSEKTFGFSPESKVVPEKGNIAGSKRRTANPTGTTDDDDASDSDTLFVPKSEPKSSRRKSKSCKGVEDEAAKPPSPKKLKTGSLQTATPSSESPIPPATKLVQFVARTGKPAANKARLNQQSKGSNGLTATQTESSKNVAPGEDDSAMPTPQPKAKSSSRPAARSGSKTDSEGIIIVAIDFGTTYSGASFAQTCLPKHQRPFTQWPDPISSNIQGKSSEKVPTKLQYSSDGSSRWGFQIFGDGELYKEFKLLLDPESTAKFYADPQAAPAGHNKEPDEIVKDYLTHLCRHIGAVLREMLPQSVVSSTPVEYVVTVPAMWSDAAVDRTRKCAELAGMGSSSTLKIVSEPEAAAIWALQDVTPGSFGIGDTFIVCDAGGGTVDLISYKVTGLKPTLKVQEVVPGRGKKCGSTFLNRRFEAFIEDKLGNHPCWQEDMLEEAANRFDGIKRQYDGSKTSMYDVPVPTFPDSPEYDVRRARYTLKGSDLHNIFEPVIEDVLGLVRQQIEATRAAKSTVKAILLVGGFGENGYLFQRLQQSVSTEEIEVLKPSFGWTAVVRGALIKGLADYNPKNAEMTIGGRSVKYHYGTESAKAWDETVHAESQRIWSAANARWQVNTYDWFVTKGTIISEKKPIRLNYHTECLATQKKLNPITVTIVKCPDPNDEGAPYFVGGTYPLKPRGHNGLQQTAFSDKSTDGEVAPVAHLEVPLSLIPIKNLKKRKSDNGQEWFIVDFTLKITRTSSEFHYDMMRGTRSYGRVSAE
ncbi:MAG: hypothetical protein Q9168_004647, partial [Polycauliona sp. 1 TL-2023]